MKVSAQGLASLTVPGSGGEVKPRVLMKEDFTVLESGKMQQGVTKVPFEFKVKGIKENALLETYHGAYISINYVVKVTVERGVMKRGLSKEIEFIIEVPHRKKGLETPEKVDFSMSPSTLDNVKSSAVGKIPDFEIGGTLHRKNCLINMPLTGEVTVAHSEAGISSIDLQLVRVESVSKALGGSAGDVSKGEMAREATEIESLQMAAGDVVRGLTIPIYMVLPRVYTCPSLKTATFQVEVRVGSRGGARGAKRRSAANM